MYFTTSFIGTEYSSKVFSNCSNTVLFNAMNYCGFSTQDIMKYLENSPSEITYNRSGTRKDIARLNKSVEAADWDAYDDGVYLDVLG